ncbi:MAG: Hpt domain-containing protein [Nitrosomonas sp.]|nr:Hpt domain-containing protein [Nitrosomonas sp.]
MATESNDQTVLNSDALGQIREINPEMGDVLVNQILQTYLDSSADLVKKIEAAINDEDAKSLQIAAHSLKSASASIGADSLSALCKVLEMSGNSGDLSQVRAVQNDANQHYQQVIAEIKKRLNQE